MDCLLNKQRLLGPLRQGGRVLAASLVPSRAHPRRNEFKHHQYDDSATYDHAETASRTFEDEVCSTTGDSACEEPLALHLNGQPSEGLLEDHYHLGEILGHGTYGVVRRAQCLATGEDVAVKILSLQRKASAADVRAKLQQEVDIHSAASTSPHVLMIGPHVFEQEVSVYIVQDLCTGGHLQDWVSQHGPFTAVELAHVLRATLRAVAHCHAVGVVHCDMKPQNLMLPEPYDRTVDPPCKLASALGGVKVMDFGCSQWSHDGDTHKTDTFQGTPLYMAPQVWQKWFGPKADIWAVGVMAYQLYSGRFPFWSDLEQLQGAAKQQVMEGVFTQDVRFDAAPWTEAPQALKDLIAECLDRNETTRPSAENLLGHPFLAAPEEALWKSGQATSMWEAGVLKGGAADLLA